MPSGVYTWSQTAATNATADSSINFAEGMAPSAVNDSARALMASVAKWRDDISGALGTGGTSTAYTVTTNQVFASAALMNYAELNLLFVLTNGANPTLNVDGLGAVAITIDGTNPPPAGTLVAGTPYVLKYYHSNTTWRLKNFHQLPWMVPIGGSMDYWGTSAPNSSFAFMYGQAISRTTYSTLFGLFSTTYGVGDGSTTFNIPDLRGRVVAGKDDMGGSSANRLIDADDSLNGDTLGDTGGGETQSLVTGNLPAYTPAGSIANGAITSNVTGGVYGSTGLTLAYSGPGIQGSAGSLIVVTSTQAASTFTGTAQGGTSTAFGVVQPTIIANKILRII